MGAEAAWMILSTMEAVSMPEARPLAEKSEPVLLVLVLMVLAMGKTP